MFRGHHGNRTVQLPPRYPIEVITMRGVVNVPFPDEAFGNGNRKDMEANSQGSKSVPPQQRCSTAVQAHYAR
jgi:hypothetical protein